MSPRFRRSPFATSSAWVLGVALVLASTSWAAPSHGIDVDQVLGSFELKGKAAVDVSDGSGDVRRRTFHYSALVNGSRYRIEIRSEGADIGVLPRASVAFDGQESWLLLPHGDVITVRTGDIEGPLPLPLPDPLLLQLQATLQVHDPSASALELRQIGGDIGLRRSLLGADGFAGQAQATQLDDFPAASGGAGAPTVSWRLQDGRRVPVAFAARRGDTSAQWEVIEFLPPREASGVPGIPRRLIYEVRDPGQAPYSDLRMVFEVLLFRYAPDRPVADFRLNEHDPSMTIWHEDTGRVLRRGKQGGPR